MSNGLRGFASALLPIAAGIGRGQQRRRDEEERARLQALEEQLLKAQLADFEDRRTERKQTREFERFQRRREDQLGRGERRATDMTDRLRADQFQQMFPELEGLDRQQTLLQGQARLNAQTQRQIAALEPKPPEPPHLT